MGLAQLDGSTAPPPLALPVREQAAKVKCAVSCFAQWESQPCGVAVLIEAP